MRVVPRLIALLSLAVVLGGCVAGQQLMQAMAQEMQRQNMGQELGVHQPGKTATALNAAKPDSASAELDSLFKLISQDVGINPDEGHVQKLIWRTRVIRMNAETARQAIQNCRTEIFNIAANTEQLRALKEMDAQIDTAQGAAKDELIAARKRYEEAAIDSARNDGSLEQKRLGTDQAARVGLLLYNLGVAGICDNLALRHLPNIDNDFKEVKADLFDRGGSNALWAGMSLGVYAKEFLAIPGDLIHFGIELPKQLFAIGNLVGTIGVLKKNNQIEEREAKPGDSFQSLEEF
ncbi:MAG: hypothetical protein KDC10_01725 [Calditrichaeota bacterium]|nr:hypothetical protein [Candidatus Cloacimonadota bacterium]MCB1045893.1 hypothetical protein [Calditrichota bacterium]MCB9474737.1 hypothetical protein [Candidatus Delongbacteria bacterium]